MEKILLIIPKLKGPIQLSGLVFTIIAYTLIHRVDPSNIKAVSLVGAIGIATLVIPLAYHASILKLIPKSQRSLFLLITLALLLGSFGAIASITYNTLLNATGARFDTYLKKEDVDIFDSEDGRSIVQIKMHFTPISNNNNEGATVFTGIIAIHDEEIGSGGIGEVTTKSCSEVSSCVGSYYFKELADKPLYVRADSKETTQVFTIKTKQKLPKLFTIWRQFYQRKGISGGRCEFDYSKPPPRDGIPYLTMRIPGNQSALDCYLSTNQLTMNRK